MGRNVSVSSGAHHKSSRPVGARGAGDSVEHGLAVQHPLDAVTHPADGQQADRQDSATVLQARAVDLGVQSRQSVPRHRRLVVVSVVIAEIERDNRVEHGPAQRNEVRESVFLFVRRVPWAGPRAVTGRREVHHLVSVLEGIMQRQRVQDHSGGEGVQQGRERPAEGEQGGRECGDDGAARRRRRAPPQRLARVRPQQRGPHVHDRLHNRHKRPLRGKHGARQQRAGNQIRAIVKVWPRGRVSERARSPRLPVSLPPAKEVRLAVIHAPLVSARSKWCARCVLRT